MDKMTANLQAKQDEDVKVNANCIEEINRNEQDFPGSL